VGIGANGHAAAAVGAGFGPVGEALLGIDLPTIGVI